MKPWIKISFVFMALAGLVAFLLIDGSAANAFVYSKLVDEVMQQPNQYLDKPLRVEGDLKQGSIQFREEPCEWRFILEKGEYQMPVRFPQCVVPDTFRDGFGISVIVQGKIQEEKYFLADELVPRCPSKYEMKEKMKNGEEIPHSMPAAQANF